MYSKILDLKQRLSNSLIYKYIKLNCDIYLGYILFYFYHLKNIKHNLWIFDSEQNIHLYLLEKPNGLQYFFVTINLFCFVILCVSVVQIVNSGRKWKGKLFTKILSLKSVTQFWIPKSKSSNWTNVENRYISSNWLYPSCFLNTLYKSLYHGFPFSLKWLPHLEKIKTCNFI